jgi:hypothetical protein
MGYSTIQFLTVGIMKDGSISGSILTSNVLLSFKIIVKRDFCHFDEYIAEVT